MTTTLRHVFEKQYRVLRLRNASPSTHRLYEVTLRLLDRYLKRPATLGDLNDATISEYLIHSREKGDAPGTINRNLNNLLAIWRWCHRQRMVEAWPNLQQEKVPVRTPVAWTRDEFDRLMHAVNRQRGSIPGTGIRAADWWTALLLLAFDTGERIGALRALKWESISLETRDIVFRAETRKGRARDNAVKISKQTAQSLEKLKRSNGLVFRYEYSYTYLWRQFKVILESAGLPADRLRMFHCVRKTTASHFKAAGGDAGRLLGHASNVSTQKYLDPKIVKQPAAHELIFRPIVPETDSRLMKVEDAAKFLRVSEDTLYRWVRRLSGFPSEKVGGIRFIDVVAAQAWMAKNDKGPREYRQPKPTEPMSVLRASSFFNVHADVVRDWIALGLPVKRGDDGEPWISPTDADDWFGQKLASERYIRVSKAHQHFGVAESTFREWREHGLPELRLARRVVLIDVAQAEAWISAQPWIKAPSVADLPTGFLSVTRAADYFGVNESTLRGWRRRGFPLSPAYSQPVIDVAAAEEWVASQEWISKNTRRLVEMRIEKRKVQKR